MRHFIVKWLTLKKSTYYRQTRVAKRTIFADTLLFTVYRIGFNYDYYSFSKEIKENGHVKEFVHRGMHLAATKAFKEWNSLLTDEEVNVFCAVIISCDCVSVVQ